MPAAVELPVEKLRGVCQRYRIARLSLFGSVLRGSHTDESDIDLLVEFLPGQTPGLRFFALQEELSDLLGRKVDLNTPEDLSRFFREDVRRTARTLYAA